MVPHSRKLKNPKRELDRLEAALTELKIEFDKFFNGALAIPPERLRTDVERRFRLLRTQRFRAFADRFRFNGLETRLNVLNELFNRRLREAERAARRSDHAQGTPKSGPDPFAGVDLGTGNNQEAAEALYRELYRSSGRGRKIDFASFEQYLDNQLERLRKKTGCERVQFRVSGSGRKLKLKAKPIKSPKSTDGASA